MDFDLLRVLINGFISTPHRQVRMTTCSMVPSLFSLNRLMTDLMQSNFLFFGIEILLQNDFCWLMRSIHCMQTCLSLTVWSESSLLKTSNWISGERLRIEEFISICSEWLKGKKESTFENPFLPTSLTLAVSCLLLTPSRSWSRVETSFKQRIGNRQTKLGQCKIDHSEDSRSDKTHSLHLLSFSLNFSSDVLEHEPENYNA